MRLPGAGCSVGCVLAQAFQDLGYSPLWSVREGLHLTLRAFSCLRNPDEPTPYMNSAQEVHPNTDWSWWDVCVPSVCKPRA